MVEQSHDFFLANWRLRKTVIEFASKPKGLTISKCRRQMCQFKKKASLPFLYYHYFKTKAQMDWMMPMNW
jgi:hypothetical protein